MSTNLPRSLLLFRCSDIPQIDPTTNYTYTPPTHEQEEEYERGRKQMAEVLALLGEDVIYNKTKPSNEE